MTVKKQSDGGLPWARVGAELGSSRLGEIADYFEPTGVSVPHVVAAGAIVLASKLVQAAEESALEEVGLTLSKFELLGMLTEDPAGQSPLKELGRRSLLHPATLSWTVAALEEQGYVTRSRDPADKRVVIAAITKAGRAKVAESITALAAIDFGLDNLSAGEAAAVVAALARVTAETHQ